MRDPDVYYRPFTRAYDGTQTDLYAYLLIYGGLLTRLSRSGFLIYLNMAPSLWYTKKQATVETSTFGSEFIAMRIATEHIQVLRYKLRSFGIPINEPTFMYGDN